MSTNFLTKLSGADKIIAKLETKLSRYRVRERKLSRVVEEKVRELFVENSKLRDTTSELERAKTETDIIFSNINEGLFLIDPELKIGAQYSKSLERILDKTDLANIDFLDLMKGILSKADMDATLDYFKVKFNEDIDEEDIDELNPLESIDISLQDEDNLNSHTKFLSIKTYRVYSGKKITNLLANVVDKTDEMLLKLELEKTEKRRESELETLQVLIKVEPTRVEEYLAFIRDYLTNYNDILRRKTDNYSKEVLAIARVVHKIKGLSSSVGLASIVHICHSVEDKIQDMSKQKELLGDDFLSLVIDLKKFQNAILDVESSLAQLIQYGSSTSKTLIPSVNGNGKHVVNANFARNLKQLVSNLNSQLSLDAVLKLQDVQVLETNMHAKEFLEVFIQLIRNSFAHGFSGSFNDYKRQPVIEIHVSQEKNDLVVRYEDNGTGLDTNTLKNRIANRRDVPVESISSKDVINSIFIDNMSIKKESEIDALSGRGVGMNIVYKNIKDMSGKIRVHSVRGKSFKLIIAIPFKENLKGLITNEESLSTNATANVI